MRAAAVREYGKSFLEKCREDALFFGLPTQMQVWMSHGDLVVNIPEGFQVTARTGDCPVAAMSDPERKLYGVQFHPEVRHTPLGDEILKNFCFEFADVAAVGICRILFRRRLRR